jgi:hypothetical protein
VSLTRRRALLDAVLGRCDQLCGIDCTRREEQEQEYQSHFKRSVISWCMEMSACLCADELLTRQARGVGVPAEGARMPLIGLYTTYITDGCSDIPLPAGCCSAKKALWLCPAGPLWDRRSDS